KFRIWVQSSPCFIVDVQFLKTMSAPPLLLKENFGMIGSQRLILLTDLVGIIFLPPNSNASLQSYWIFIKVRVWTPCLFRFGLLVTPFMQKVQNLGVSGLLVDKVENPHLFTIR